MANILDQLSKSIEEKGTLPEFPVTFDTRGLANLGLALLLTSVIVIYMVKIILKK